MENDRYLEWFNELPEPTRTRMAGAWGNPPGEEKDGIPAAMVYDGRILVTGLRFGNAVVCVQPKRGCAAAPDATVRSAKYSMTPAFRRPTST